MSCTPSTGAALASTGASVAVPFAVGLALLAVGVVLIVLARRRGSGSGGGAAWAGVFLVAVTVTSLGGSAAKAEDEPLCPPTGAVPSLSAVPPLSAVPSLSIVQTSLNTGMAPGIAPGEVTGTITNRGAAGTFVTTVTVSISAVAKAASAAPGRCDVTDFVLLNPRMPVHKSLGPNASADFRGAAIGFLDKPVVQDACRGAYLTLAYRSD